MNAKGDYGRALYAMLDDEWKRQNTSRGAWCLAHGLHATTVKRWGEGSDPDLPTLRLVADALGAPMLSLLVTIGVLSPEEVGQQEVSVTEAIKRSDLSPDRKRALQHVLDAFNQIDAGAEEVSYSPRRGVKVRKPRH